MKNIEDKAIDINSLTRYEPAKQPFEMEIFEGGRYVRFAAVAALIASAGAEGIEMNQTTNTTASIDLAQLDKLEALARAADPMGAMHLVTHYRNSADTKAEEAWRRVANPTTVQQLIAPARRPLTSGAPAEQANSAVETEMADRLRRIVANHPGATIQVSAKTLTAAADECDRFYNGMMNWKTNAQAKDRIIIELREVSAGAAAKTDHAMRGAAIASAVNSIDRGEDDDGPETPGIWTKEEVLDMLKYEIVTDSGAKTLLNGDGMEFDLTELALLANRAAHLTKSASAAGAGSDQAGDVDLIRVPAHEADSYCRILTILGMEEEGDPVAEVQRLFDAANAASSVTVQDEQRNPTEAMLNAARDWSVKKYGIGIGNDAAIGCWQAMFDAQQDTKGEQP